MNPFFDPGKRSFDLPFGCKDLIDVLHKLKAGTGQSVADSLDERFRTDCGNVGQTKKYFVRLFSSEKAKRMVTIAVSNTPIVLIIGWGGAGANLDFVLELKHWGVRLETAIESLFGKDVREIDSPDSRGIHVRLPDSPIEAARTISSLLVDGFGIEPEQELMFNYSEFD